MTEKEKTMGWEIARELETEKTTVWARFVPEWKQLRAALAAVVVFFIIFLVGCWLAGNPFDATQRLASEVVKAKGWVGTNEWQISGVSSCWPCFLNSWMHRRAWDLGLS